MPKACLPSRHCGFLLWKNCHLFRAEREKVSIISNAVQAVSKSMQNAWAASEGVGFPKTTVELNLCCVCVYTCTLWEKCHLSDYRFRNCCVKNKKQTPVSGSSVCRIALFIWSQENC